MSISPLFSIGQARKKKRCKHGPGSPAWPIFVRHAQGPRQRGGGGKKAKNEENSRENKKKGPCVSEVSTASSNVLYSRWRVLYSYRYRIYLFGIIVKLYSDIPGCTVGEYMCSWIIRYCRWPKQCRKQTPANNQRHDTRSLVCTLQLHLEMASLAY